MLDADTSLPQSPSGSQPTGVTEATALPDQHRRLVTEIPGPRSRELAARKSGAVASGVGTMLPIYVERAGGGIVVDVDGNHLIDLGSGIAVTNVGNAAPAVVAGVQEQVARFTHTCFMITPYEGYVAVCERLNALTPGDHDKRSALFNSGAEAVENAVKIARHATGRDAVVVFDHAYHGRTNLTMAMTAKSMPYKSGFGPFAGEVYRAPMSYPFRDAADVDGAAAAARAIADDRGAGRRRGTPRASSSSRSRARAGSSSPPRGSCPRWRSGAATTASCSSPTRSRPASPAPATCSPASTRASSRTSSRPPRASPAACRSPRSPAAPR